MEDLTDVRREGSAREFFSVLFRRKWILAFVFLGTVGVVVTVDSLTPTMYESTAQLLLSRGQAESAFSPRWRLLTWEEEVTSELETVRSAHVLQMAQKLLDERGAVDSEGKPIVIRPGQVSAVTMGKSSVIYIRARSADPRTSQETVRAVAQAYSDFRRSVRGVPELEAYFREEIETVRRRLEDWDQRRADYMNAEAFSRINDERYNLLEVRRSAEIDLGRVRTDLAAEQARIEVLRAMLVEVQRNPEMNIYAFSHPATRDDQVMFEIKQELVRRQAAYLQARATYQDDYPEVLSLKDQVDQLRAVLLSEVEAYVRHLEAKVEVNRAKEESILNTLAYVDAEIASFPRKEAGLAAYDRMIQSLESAFSAMVSKQVQARLEKVGSSDWNVLILQPAGEPQPQRLNDVVRLALIPAIGLIVATALAFIADGLDHSIKDAIDAERRLNLPVLGSLGRMR